MELFLTTHNTDFTELRGWQQPDGIWSTELRGLGGMQAGAYKPGQGVDVRAVTMNAGYFTTEPVKTTVVVGGYIDHLGQSRIGFVPKVARARATAEQIDELRKLEAKLGRSFVKEAHDLWLERLHVEQARRVARVLQDPEPDYVWLVVSPVQRAIGDYKRQTWQIQAVYRRREALETALAEYRRTNPLAPAVKYVAVAIDARFDLDQLAGSAEAFAESLPNHQAEAENAELRYAQLRTELGI